ncbi:MAG: hypothetical protein SFU56_15150 [Capsulimonadales bacterium]|nr:hypothetical protein [Capsulimonadales bacterium]
MRLRVCLSLSAALLVLSAISGCSNPEPAPSPSPTVAAQAPPPGQVDKKMAGSVDLSVDPAPPGVKTDLSGGKK